MRDRSMAEGRRFPRLVAWTSRLSAAVFGIGLLLPAGGVATAGGGVQAVTGFHALRQAVVAGFPFALLVVPALPVGLQAAFGASRRSMWGAGACLLALAIPGLLAGPGGAHLAWMAAAALLVAAGTLAGVRRVRATATTADR